MIKGSEIRQAGHPIEKLFVDRWSPRAMSGEAIPEPELLSLFEAARWAPSSSNNQPWRMLYAHRDTAHWPLFFGLLVEANQAWCARAAVLVVVISKTTFDHNDKPSPTHSFDAGAAWENLALQGAANGLAVHGMAGFDYARAQAELGIPAVYKVEAMVAIGRPGRTEELAAKYQEREVPSQRRPLAQTICEGPFRL
jgi:nitroreductase